MKQIGLSLCFWAVFGLHIGNCQQLPMPVFKSVEASYQSIAISWDSVAGADGYEIVIVDKNQATIYVGNTAVELSEFILPGTVYTIYLRAYAFKNDIHSRQASYCLLTPPKALPPTKVKKNSFVANWERQLKGYHYYFYLSTDENFDHLISPFKGLRSKANKYKVAGIEEGKTYYYRIKTIDLTQKEHFSNTVSVQL